MRFRVIDLETTGLEPPAEVIEVGRSDVVLDANGVSIEPPLAWLYRPVNGIPPETMAVHHLTEADFGPDTFPCSPGHLQGAITHGAPAAVYVAHNCEFERKFITPNISGTTPWICTYKVALHVWPDAPRHGNQVLRYWRGLVLDPQFAMPPHRAGPDAWVTAHILGQLLMYASPEQMIAWTNQPKRMPTIPFGKHKGTEWAALPIDYLNWMVRQEAMDPDALWYANQELARRK